MSRGPSPIVRRRRLGNELRRLREAAGLTGDQVIARVGWASASKLSRLENARSRPDLADILDLLEVYGVQDAAREELIALARDAGNTRGWRRDYPVMTERQRRYAELESGCVDIREYSPAIVPGLLQTPGYARVRILSSRPLSDPQGGRNLEAEVGARRARQAILTRDADPPQYEAVLDEAALTGRGGPPEVMREQLEHLCRLSELPTVTLRVLPHDATIGDWYLPHTGFSIYRFADPADPETVAIEALTGDLLLDDKAEIARYAVVFDWLRAAALAPEKSLQWLTNAARSTGVNGSVRRSAPRPRRSERAVGTTDDR